MPLVYDDEPGSWGKMSEGWTSTPYTMGKWLLCTKANLVPYGSYVMITPNYPDETGAFIRIETEALKQKLESAYIGMFQECRSLLLEKEFKIPRRLSV